jgi:hypothetical protein
MPSMDQESGGEVEGVERNDPHLQMAMVMQGVDKLDISRPAVISDLPFGKISPPAFAR